MNDKKRDQPPSPRELLKEAKATAEQALRELDEAAENVGLPTPDGPVRPNQPPE